MRPGVLDSVVAIEAKAAKIVEDAQGESQKIQDEVQTNLARLAEALETEAEEIIGKHAESVAARTATVLAELEQQLTAALDALEIVKATQLDPMAAEVTSLLEQGGDGH